MVSNADEIKPARMPTDHQTSPWTYGWKSYCWGLRWVCSRSLIRKWSLHQCLKKNYWRAGFQFLLNSHNLASRENQKEGSGWLCCGNLKAPHVFVEHVSMTHCYDTSSYSEVNLDSEHPKLSSSAWKLGAEEMREAKFTVLLILFSWLYNIW